MTIFFSECLSCCDKPSVSGAILLEQRCKYTVNYDKKQMWNDRHIRGYTVKSVFLCKQERSSESFGLQSQVGL